LFQKNVCILKDSSDFLLQALSDNEDEVNILTLKQNTVEGRDNAYDETKRDGQSELHADGQLREIGQNYNEEVVGENIDRAKR